MPPLLRITLFTTLNVEFETNIVRCSMKAFVSIVVQSVLKWKCICCKRTVKTFLVFVTEGEMSCYGCH
jgi:hypothetical protein